jgi:hypothetical protein
MASSATYQIKSVAFTPDGGSAQVIDGIEEVSISQNGQVVAHGTDGAITIMSHFVDNIEGQVMIRTRNAVHFVDADFQIGLHGSLVITMQKRKDGKGAVAGQDKVITAAEATVTRSNATIPHADRSNLELEFAVADADVSAPFAYS